MKKQTAFLLYSAMVFFFASCMQSNESTSTKSTKSAIAVAKLKDTISEAKFIEWTNRWAANSKGYMDTSTINYFIMPKIDLEEYLGEATGNARFYIGLDSLSKKNYLPKLILTGARNKGAMQGENGGHKFDLSNVCPPTCDSLP